MRIFKHILKTISALVVFIFLCITVNAQTKPFKVIAFYTAKDDLAHISFVHEANKWFPQMGAHNIISLMIPRMIGII